MSDATHNPIKQLPSAVISPTPNPFWRGVRIGFFGLILMVEVLFISALVQRFPLDRVAGPAHDLRDVQHWLFRFVIAYVGSVTMLAYLRHAGSIPTQPANRRPAARVLAGGIHVLLLVLLGMLCANVYGNNSLATFVLLAIAWHLCGMGALASLLLVAAPWASWLQWWRRLGNLPLYAVLPAAAAVVAIPLSQAFWAPSARLTFRLVEVILRPLCSSLQVDVTSLTVGTSRFAVTISDQCSGLEGISLMLAFGCTWLWRFRRDYRFPRAFFIVPIAMLLVFFLNALRIAGMVLIGDAGHPGIATVGFHSQAGWIAFTAAALGVAVISRRSAFLYQSTRPSDTGDRNPATVYLMPLLAILAVGMMTRALSSGVELLYPLRVVASIVVLFLYRRRYVAMDWSVSWRAPAMGALMFAAWIVFAHFLIAPSREPETLSSLPAVLSAVWIACRVLAAVVTVPFAEELGYRGYLLRRLISRDFETVAYREVRWPTIVVCAIAFGLTHGALWLPATLAGFGYGLLVVNTGKLGDAMVAHGTTNALLAAYVLGFGQWQLW